MLKSGAAVLSALLNGGSPVDKRDWSVAAMTGVRTSGRDLLHLSLVPTTGIEVARNLNHGLELFAQGWLDSTKDVSALGGLRWRF